MCYYGHAKKNFFRFAQLEVLGIQTSGRSDTELTILYSLLPRIEAYKEYVDRRSQEQLSPERAFDLVFAVTDDVAAADSAYNNVKFSQTPLE